MGLSHQAGFLSSEVLTSDFLNPSMSRPSVNDLFIIKQLTATEVSGNQVRSNTDTSFLKIEPRRMVSFDENNDLMSQ